MRFLVRLQPKERDGPVFLSLVKSLAESVMAEARNAKWTSYAALELDIFCPSSRDFELFLAAVEPLAKVEFTRNLSEAPTYRSKEELIEEARLFFNSERYWEAHETLESVWRNSTGQEKTYLQGLILVCAAFVHHQKNEEEVAVGVMRRASRQLEYSSGVYYGINTNELKKHAEAILDSRKFEVFRV